MKGSRTGVSIRARLLLLVLAAVLPLLLFAGALLQRAFSGSMSLVEDTAIASARGLGLAVDAQIGRAQAVILALTESPMPDSEDLTQFEQTATRALAANGLEGVVLLGRADGSKASHNPPSPGAPVTDQPGLQRLFATGQPQVSDLHTGGASQVPLVALHVPVWRAGQVRFDAVLSVSARSIGTALNGQPLPTGWGATLSDRQGRVIARAGAEAPAVGETVPASLLQAAAAGEGFAMLRGDGAPFYAGFAHTATGWLVSVRIPASLVRGPRMRSIAELAAGGGVLLLASAGLAWLVGRRIAGPVHALAGEAARLGHNELPDPAATRGVAEAEAAGRALHEAGLLLAARSQDREAALARAEESEARLLLAQETGQIGVWEADAATGKRTWSPQMYALYGRDPKLPAPDGPTWSAMIHEEDRPRVRQAVARAYAGPTFHEHEFRVIHPNGTIRWLRSAWRSFFHDGMPHRMLGVTFDVTDRHEAERALREGAARLEAEVASRTQQLAASESRFRTYFEQGADALLVVGVQPDGSFVYETLNRAGEELTGYRRQDVEGKAPGEVLLPGTAAATIETFQRATAQTKPLRLEQRLALPSGTLDVEVVLMPIPDPVTGQAVRIICRLRDVTEQRRMEARLGHAQRLEAVGQLTGGVAHDFNNLLTVVVGNLSLLRRRMDGDERARRYLASIEQAAERGAKLTASLLAFSRRQTLQVAPLDVGALLHELGTLLRRALGEDVALELNVAPGLPLAIADAAQLEAAVLNLAINARDAVVDAMQRIPGRIGTLRIQVQPAVLRAEDLEGNDEAKPGRFVAIQVQDTGAGMPPEVRARAFEPFFTTKEVGRGTGLGLSQVFGFVRQLGGHVTLDSTPGHGTKAVLFLPTAVPGAARPADDPAPAAILPAAGTVLVVEDDEGIRTVTAEVLRDAGLTVLAAENAPAALLILQGSAPVDILFSDVVMPGGATGVELARAARQLRPGLSVLLTSGYGGPALSRYGAEGEYEVLAKPYTRMALLDRLGQLLAAGRQERQGPIAASPPI